MLIASTFKEATFRERNAIRSWQLAFPGARILLFGYECRDLALELDVEFYIGIRRCNDGAPYLSDMIQGMTIQARREDRALLWVNADIILFRSAWPLFCSYDRVMNPFLLTGRRVDVTVEEEIPDDLLCLEEWGREVAATGKVLPPCGADWFLWRRGMYTNMPLLAIGRCSFDNYIIYDAVQNDVERYNVTQQVLALHQVHPEAEGLRSSPQAKENQRLVKEAYPDWWPRKGWVSDLPVKSLI